jgi:hypothetical protein
MNSAPKGATEMKSRAVVAFIAMLAALLAGCALACWVLIALFAGVPVWVLCLIGAVAAGSTVVAVKARSRKRS